MKNQVPAPPPRSMLKPVMRFGIPAGIVAALAAVAVVLLARLYLPGAAAAGQNDAPALVVSAAELIIDEGDTVVYTVALATQPTDQVTVNIRKASGAVSSRGGGYYIDNNPNDHRFYGPISSEEYILFTFTTENWDTPQTVILTQMGFVDEAVVTTTFIHTASGGGYDSVSARLTVSANDIGDVQVHMSLWEVPTKFILHRPAGIGDFTYSAAFRAPIDAPITLTITAPVHTRAPDAIVPRRLTFMPWNWNTPRTVKVSFDPDGDNANDGDNDVWLAPVSASAQVVSSRSREVRALSRA